MRPIFLLLLMAATILPVQASTTAAWKALDKAARSTCAHEIGRQASRTRVTGRVSGIGAAQDADRFYALLLSGKTAGFAGQWLCLYDKRAKTAVAREMEKP